MHRQIKRHGSGSGDIYPYDKRASPEDEFSGNTHAMSHDESEASDIVEFDAFPEATKTGNGVFSPFEFSTNFDNNNPFDGGQGKSSAKRRSSSDDRFGTAAFGVSKGPTESEYIIEDEDDAFFSPEPLARQKSMTPQKPIMENHMQPPLTTTTTTNNNNNNRGRSSSENHNGCKNTKSSIKKPSSSGRARSTSRSRSKSRTRSKSRKGKGQSSRRKSKDEEEDEEQQKKGSRQQQQQQQRSHSLGRRASAKFTSGGGSGGGKEHRRSSKESGKLREEKDRRSSLTRGASFSERKSRRSAPTKDKPTSNDDTNHNKRRSQRGRRSEDDTGSGDRRRARSSSRGAGKHRRSHSESRRSHLSSKSNKHNSNSVGSQHRRSLLASNNCSSSSDRNENQSRRQSRRLSHMDADELEGSGEMMTSPGSRDNGGSGHGLRTSRIMARRASSFVAAEMLSPDEEREASGRDSARASATVSRPARGKSRRNLMKEESFGSPSGKSAAHRRLGNSTHHTSSDAFGSPSDKSPNQRRLGSSTHHHTIGASHSFHAKSPPTAGSASRRPTLTRTPPTPSYSDSTAMERRRDFDPRLDGLLQKLRDPSDRNLGDLVKEADDAAEDDEVTAQGVPVSQRGVFARIAPMRHKSFCEN